jgi:sterol desaturase/sphingolipid hydroxylase (fatty acid hydroxylase superfamily)
MLLLEFVGFFAFILMFGYLLPAGQFYARYYVRHDPAHEHLRIQQRQPTPGQIRREVKLSLVTIAIFAVMSTGLLELYKAGHTAIYPHIHDYPLWYLPVSFFLCIFLHDTYFYWTHRFMHWRPVFKYFHLAHHRSIAPTPWAIFAFNPLEAVTQFLGIMLLVMFLPLRPLILLAYLLYDTLVNTAGHTGYEVVPKPVSQNWFFKFFNTVTHHDAHHTNVRVNYGAFFNLWDRWMGTFQDGYTPATQRITPQQITPSSAARPPLGKASS